jgi:hypothetical protein
MWPGTTAYVLHVHHILHGMLTAHQAPSRQRGQRVQHDALCYTPMFDLSSLQLAGLQKEAAPYMLLHVQCGSMACNKRRSNLLRPPEA